MEPFIRAKDICVTIPVRGGAGLKIAQGQRLERQTGTGRLVVKAIDGLSLEAKVGDRIALIGPNGAGKTTLLRTLCGIFPTTSGTIESHGQMGVVFQPGLGMLEASTGYENIRIYGLFVGMRPEAIRNATREIVEFCELGDFIHLPVSTYSAGMRLRLAFAITTASRPDILLMEEVIGVGDKAFMEKAMQRRNGFLEQSKLLIVASHVRNVIEQLCNRILWLEDGHVIEDSRHVQATLRRYETWAARGKATLRALDR